MVYIDTVSSAAKKKVTRKGWGCYPDLAILNLVMLQVPVPVRLVVACSQSAVNLHVLYSIHRASEDGNNK